MKRLTKIQLFLLQMMLLFIIWPTITYAAGAPIVIDYTEELMDEVKLSAKGTINSIHDLSNGNFKVRLSTKSEYDESQLDQYILAQPIQYGAQSTMTLLNGTPTEQAPTRYKFDLSQKDSEMPSFVITNVTKTKTGQSVDMKFAITGVDQAQKGGHVRVGIGSDGAFNITMASVSTVHFSYEFLNSATKQPIDLLVFPAINDIDYDQVFSLDADILGYGLNLQLKGNQLVSDGTPTDGLNDFPLGGILYKSFGYAGSGSYSAKADFTPEPQGNGFDIFGAYGMVNDIEAVKPDFGKVVIPKASWQVDETIFKPGDEVTATFNQPINALDVNINHRYENWETILHVPAEIANHTITVMNEQGEEIPATIKQLNDTQYQVVISQETMKQIPFAGETYRFVVKGTLSDQLIDGTKVSFQADTTLDNIQDTITYDTQGIAHKIPIKVKYLRQDSTDAVAKGKIQYVGYGKQWFVAPLTAPEGYYLDEESTKDVHKGDRVDFKEKSVTFFYAPFEKTLRVRYLDEDGTKLGEELINVEYQDAYTTSAQDIDDEYSLIKEKIPKNAFGIVGNRDIHVDYYFRKTKGYWLDLGQGSRGMTKVDYNGHIRSNVINYPDGQVLSLINDDNGLIVYQDSVEESLESLLIETGKNQTIQVSANDTINIAVSGLGQATVTRKNAAYVTETKIDKGNFYHTTSQYKDKQLLETQTTHANGVQGTIIKQEIMQMIDGQFKVISNRLVKDPEKALFNQTVIDAPGTKYVATMDGVEDQETLGELIVEEDNEQPVKELVTGFLLPKIAYAQTIEEAPLDEEESMAMNDATFTDHLIGSATLPVNSEASFDGKEQLGDLEDETRAMQHFTDTYQVSVYDGEKLLKDEKVPEGEALRVTLPSPDEVQAPVELELAPEADDLSAGQVMPNDEIAPIENGQLPKTGIKQSFTMILLGVMLIVGVMVIGRRRLLSVGGRRHE